MSSVVTMGFKGKRVSGQALLPGHGCANRGKSPGGEGCGRQAFCLIEFKEQRDQVGELHHLGKGLTLSYQIGIINAGFKR